jgi:hypothetical protein
MRRLIAITAAALFAIQLAAHAAPGAVRQPRTFATAEAASQALYRAVQGEDEKELTAILGVGSELVSSPGRDVDRRDRARFAEKYREMHRLVREDDAGTVLYIGAENWPFPVPLVSDRGGWRFDADAGITEMLYRRIGENELNALQACRALALAQQQKEWPERDPSMRPLRVIVDAANGPGARVALHGYRFRRVGPSFVAVPETYGSSGVMTFVVDATGAVYAKDLGPQSSGMRRNAGRYAPDPTWHRDE